MSQSLLSDGHIKGDLTLQEGQNIIQGHIASGSEHILNRPAILRFLGLRDDGLFHNGYAILFDGSNIGYTIVDGKIVPTDSTKEVDPETGELKEAKKQETTTKDNNGKTNNGKENNGQANNGEQSSTTGGQGNSQTSGAPGGDANVPDEPSGGMSPEEAFGKFGAEFIGSGLDTSGFDHGDGGHGTIFE